MRFGLSFKTPQLFIPSGEHGIEFLFLGTTERK
jgi:hypothetical protein